MFDFSKKLEIAASTSAYDYEVPDSEFWPPPPPKPLTPEEVERLRGTSFLMVQACWVFHKNDVDPWPSMLHGHHNQRPLKLDAITGFIYDIHTRKHVQSLRRKALRPIQAQLLASKDFGIRAQTLFGLQWEANE